MKYHSNVYVYERHDKNLFFKSCDEKLKSDGLASKFLGNDSHLIYRKRLKRKDNNIRDLFHVFEQG